jgi:hypothetical protein
MVSHVVLFRPKAGLSSAQREAFIDALMRARREIPAIRRFRVGKRVTHGREYERAMPDFPYAAIIDFDDLAGLKTYLEHPAHRAVGELFGATLEAGLVYDFEMVDDVESVGEIAES